MNLKEGFIVLKSANRPQTNKRVALYSVPTALEAPVDISFYQDVAPT